MDFEDLGKLQWELQAATDRAQRRYQEMRFANHRAEQAEKAAAEHEFYRRDAEIKHQREAVYLHEIIRKLQQQVHEEQEAKTKAETNAFELNNVIVKQEQEQEKLKREHAQTVQKAVAPLQQQMQHLFTQLRNAKAEQNRVVEQATLNLSVRCDKLEAAKNDLEDAKKALEEYKKDLEEKLVKSSEFYNTSLRTMQAQLMEERRFKDVLQKQNHFLQNRLQHHINGVRQEPPINAIATTLSPSSSPVAGKKRKANDGSASPVMASQPPSSALVGHSRFSSIGPDVPQNLLLKPHMPQQPTKAFNPAGFVNTRSNLPVILNTYHDAPVPLKSQYSMNGQHQESGSQFANSVSQPQPQPQQQQQQRQQQQQQLALAPNNPGIYPSTSQAQGQGMQTRAGLRSAPLRTPGVTPRATPEPPQTRKVSCLHCHSFWWDETCDNNEPCANCVATTAGNAAHACERPKCKNYNDPENCVHKDRCKRAHNTDNYVNLANYQQILRRKFVKKEAVNHPSPALGGNSTTMAGANARTQREGTTTKDAETGAMME